MFKLIKILNSGVNVPEPVRVNCAPENSFAIGSALTLDNGLAVNCSETSAPLYVCAEEAKGGKDSVLCYPVFDNMLFETRITASPEGLKCGDKLTLFVDENLVACAVTATTAAGVATIHDLAGATAEGDKIIVKF